MALLALIVVSALLAPRVGAAATPALTEVQQVYKTSGANEALRRVGVLIAQHRDDPTLRFQQGVMLAEQHRNAEAVKVFQQLAHDFPDLPEAFNNLAVLYAEQGQIDKASATLEQAIRTRPNYGTAFDNLRTTYSRMAGRAYAKALQIEETPAPPKLALIQELYDPPSVPASNIAATVSPSLQVPIPASSPTIGRTSVGLASGVAALPPPVVVAAAPATGTKPPSVNAAPSTQRASPASSAAPASAPIHIAIAVPTAAAPVAAPPVPKPSAPALAAPPRASPPGASSPVAASSATPVTARPPAVAVSKSPPPSARATDDAQQIRTVVIEWARAWERKEVASYFAFYVPGFKGTDTSAAAWQAARKARILGKKRITVEISGISVSIEKGLARATFRQDYAADQLRFSNQKTLQLVDHGGKWLIDKEMAGT